MKIPEPRKLSSGNWYIYLRLNGRGISITEPTKAACIARARSVKSQYKAGELDIKPPGAEAEATTPTLGAVIDAYIGKYEPDWSPATTRGYGIIRRNRFRDYMGEGVTGIDFQQMVNEELAVAGAKTVKNAWGLVSAALGDAGISFKKVKVAPAPVPDTPFLQPEEIGPFLKEIEGDRAELFLLLELQGLRYSEVRGLTWEQIDLKKGLINIRGAVVPGKDNKFIKKDTNKNNTSSRSVPILIPRLEAVLAEAKGDFPGHINIHPLVTQRHAEAACRRAGITVVTNHGLRHSFASLCRYLGLPEEQTMAWGGWKDYYTMHKIYIRIAEKAKTEHAARFRDFIQNAN